MQAWVEVAQLRQSRNFRGLLAGVRNIRSMKPFTACHKVQSADVAMSPRWQSSKREADGRLCRCSGALRSCHQATWQPTCAWKRAGRSCTPAAGLRYSSVLVHPSKLTSTPSFAPGRNHTAAMQVSVTWRNAYTAASLLCAYKLAGVPAAQPAQPAAHEAADVPENANDMPTSDSIAAISAAAAAHALRQLDMAALLGGLLFRPQLDACIASLQTSVSATCCRPPSPGATAGELSPTLGHRLPGTSTHGLALGEASITHHLAGACLNPRRSW